MKRALVLMAALAASPLAACGGPTTTPMVNAPQTPAAEGSVSTSVGENGNTHLTLQVSHLAPPERVVPGAKVYVVWIAPENGRPQNAGALYVDQSLNGRLDTVTPYTTFEVYVTAEGSPTAPGPSGPRVLTAVVSQ